MEGSGEVTLDRDGATVTFERVVGAPILAVWALLSEGPAISSWLAATTLEGREGGAVTVDFGAEGGMVTGTVTSWRPPRSLSYTWTMPGEIDSLVEWSLAERGAATVVRLVHRTLPRSMGAGYGAGWHAYLDRLAASATHRPVPRWDTRFASVLDHYGTS
jgi:uncharacterized protein YndB with AHSA1/START domain